MVKLGFIGIGNMGSVMALCAGKSVPGAQILVSSRNSEKAEAFAQANGFIAAENHHIAEECSMIFLGVKPYQIKSLLESIRPILAERTDSYVLVSMAAGLTMEQIRQMAGGDYPVIRIMPNTPVAVGQGVILYDTTENVSNDALALFCDAMSRGGLLDRLPEKHIDAGSAVAGCGPAFTCLFLEALADGGVACGLPRAKAMEYAAQMLRGTAALAMETGQHPGAMKDAVCSPGGSTIAGVRALEQGGFRAAVMNAVDAAFLRTKELGK